MGILGAYLAYTASKIHWGAKRNLIRGESDKKKIAEALGESQIIQDLTEQGFSAEEIMEALSLRTARGKEFELVTGVPWPL